MKGRIFSIVLSLIFIISLVGCAPAATETAVEPIKIGGVFDLTGAVASLGVPNSNGAKLAVKELNAKGGILGRPVELIIRDSKTEAVTSANAATELVESQKVSAVIGTVDSDVALAIGPVTQAAGIPFVTTGATSPKLPAQIGNTVFLAAFADNTQAAAAAEYAYNELGARTVYVLWEKGIEYTTILAEYFQTRWVEMAGADSVLLVDFYMQGDPSVPGQIAKVKALPIQPDVMFIASEPDDCGIVVKQFRDAGLMQPIFGGDAYDTPLLTEVAAGVSDVYYTAPSLLSETEGTPVGQEFYKKYKAEFGNAPENAFPALGYDAIMILARAIEAAGSTDGAKIIAEIEKLKDMPGVAGNLTFGPELNQHIPVKQVAMIRTVNGKLTLAAMYAPKSVPAP